MSDRRLSTASASGGLQVPDSPNNLPRNRSRESVVSMASTVRSGPGHRRRGSSPGPSPRPDYLRHSRISSGGGSRDSIMTFATQTSNVLRPKKWKPFFLEPMATLVIVAALIVIAVVLEFMLRRSNNHEGFSAGPLNQFGATQFAKSFVPALLSMPLMFVIRKGNQQLKSVAPYSELAKGGAVAKKSLLVNYAQSNAYSVAVKSLIAGQLLVTFSCLAAIGGTFIQPLAGSLFLVRSTPRSIGASANGLMAIGLNPLTSTLIPFVEASGYVAAAVTNNLADPPLIRGGWTIPQYETDKSLWSFTNATLFLKSPAIQTQVQCVPGDVSMTHVNNVSASALVMTASLGGGFNASCQFNVSIDSPDVNWQSGANPVDTSCNQLITDGSKSKSGPPTDDLSEDFRSVAFWVFSWAEKNGTAIFCTPKLTAHNVLVETIVANNTIRNVSITGEYSSGNNVTGAPLNGLAFNGISFSNTSYDKFTRARALVSPMILSDAILRKGQSLSGGLKTMLTNDTESVELVTRLYTQFLAVAAASIYFVPTPVTLDAWLSTYTLRLWMDPFATHTLAGLCALIAAILAVVHTLDQRKRRNLFVSCEPGSLAAAAAVLSQSRFARTLIRANQDIKEIDKTLKGMRFGFDMRTWSVEAEGYNADDYIFYAKGEGMTPHDDNDVEQTGLLASQQMEMTPYASAYPPGTEHDERSSSQEREERRE